MQEIKKTIKKPQHILKQLESRIKERETVNSLISEIYLENNIDKFTDCNRYNCYKNDSYVFKNNFKDCFCSLITDEGEVPFFIEHFKFINNEHLICGRRFIEYCAYFEEPVDSKISLGILKVRDLAAISELFNVAKISGKYCRLPLVVKNNTYLLIPMLHVHEKHFFPYL